MNIWLLLNILILISSSYIAQSTDNNNDLIKEYTYYFQTFHYKFQFDFDHHINHNETIQNVIITNKDLINNNDINIQYDDININVIFLLNSSSYIFNINNNISLNYEYDKDWNEIETLTLTTPSQIEFDHDINHHHDIQYFELNDDEFEDEFGNNFEEEFDDKNWIDIGHDFGDDIHHNDNDEYIISEYDDLNVFIDDDDDNIYDETTSNITLRRRLYESSTKRGRYIGVKHPRQFHDAERICRHRYGGELASVRNSGDNSKLQRLCKQLSSRSSCWIGLRRPFKQWTNGRRVGYKHWQPGEPNNAGRHESCTEMYRSSRWNDNQCKRTRPFICETARISKKKKYIAVGMALDWDNANEYCHRRFMTELATIKSSRDNKRVRSVCNNVARRGSCWIGLERPFKKWQDGTRVTYKHWQPGEPNNWGGGESCTEQYHSKRWNDLACRAGRFFVCNYKGTDKRLKRRKRRKRGRRGRGRKRKKRRKRRKRGRRRRKCNRSCRRRRKRRKGRWNCNKLKFKDYERKQCLRRRRSMIRRFGRRRARRRWSRRSGGQRRGYGGFGGMGGFRRGYVMGKSAAMRGRGRGGMMRGGMMRGFGGRGRGRRRISRTRMPRVRMPRMPRLPRMRQIKGGFPQPPRIQLVDLPRHRRSSSRRLGVGMNIGRHHRKYNIFPSVIRNAMAQGMGMKDLKRAAQLTDIAYKQERRDQKKKAKKAGFAGFRGFDGFGSGRLKNRGKGGKDRGGNNKRMGPETVTFGMEGRRRRLMVDEHDIDVYDYDDMENKRKCIIYKEKNVYEICVGYDFVDIKKFIKREEKLVNLDKMKNGEDKELSLMDDDFMKYIGYEYSKYKSMMKNDNIYKNMKLNDNDYTHYLNIYEFIYDETAENNEQCFMYLEPFEICLNINDKNQMIVNIENDDYDENNKYNFNFSNDNDWNEIDEIINNDKIISISKCVRLFETKVCMHCQNDSRFKMLLYKTA